MKKPTKKLWLLCMAILFAFAAKAQTTCSTATSYTYPISQTVSSYTNSVFWFKVSLDTGNYQVNISNMSGTGKVVRMDIYTATSCADTVLVETDSLGLDSSLLSANIYNSVPTLYYVRLSFSGGSTTFGVQSAPQCYIVGETGFCPGQSITLVAYAIGTSSATATYTWSANAGGGTATTVSLTPTSSTVYSLTCLVGSLIFTPSVTVLPLSGDNCNSCQMVKNGAFESISQGINSQSNIRRTPCTTSLLSAPAGWIAPNCGTSDYYNAIFNSPNNNVGVPTNANANLTAAHSGNGYAGFYTRWLLSANGREYVEAPLTCSLTPGQQYKVSFWISSSTTPGYDTPSNNIGAYLSSGVLGISTPYNLNYVPQVNTTSVITVDTTWTQISGIVTGSNENHITIGNFYDDIHTTPFPVTSSSYYFVDDVSVLPLTPTITASSCQSGTVTLTAAGAASAYTSWYNGVTTYTGNPVAVPSPSVATTYTCTLNLSCGTCSPLTATYTINPATACSGTINPVYTPTVNYSFTGSPGYAASNITVSSGISYTINSTDLRMAPGTNITVASGGTLTIEGSWIHACNNCGSTNMWQGIIVENGGTLTIKALAPSVAANIIEDAVQAVYTASCTSTCTTVPVWKINNVIFNNNATGIYIDTHQGDLSANVIGGSCVFTCRNIANHAVSVANCNAIISDIVAATPAHPSTQNPTDFTIAGLRTKYGVYVNAVKAAHPVNIGATGTGARGSIFDNVDYGIYTTGSQVVSKNCRFQNITGNTSTTIPTGIGIYAEAGTPQKGGLIAGNSSYATINNAERDSFINCLIGVYTSQLNNIAINNNYFNNETTATTFSTSGSFVTGLAGVATYSYAAYSSTTAEQLQYANNNCNNYATGYFFDFQKLFNTGSASTYFYNNNITGVNTGGQYCNTGIYMQQSSRFGANTGVPWDAVSVNSNNINNIINNCIVASSITTNSMVTISNNTLTVQYNPSASSSANPPIAAVYITGCNYLKVSNNPVVGTVLTSYPRTNAQYIAGVYINASTNSRITCNAISGVGEDFVWYGNSTGSTWKENSMHNSRYGLTLRSTGIIGDQGPDAYADFNVWGKSGSDITSDQTLADNSDPSAMSASSKLYCLNTATVCSAPTVQRPCSNGFINLGNPYSNGSTLIILSSASPSLCTSEGGNGRMAAGGSNSVQDATSDSVLLSLLNFTDSLPGYTKETHWGMQYYVSSVNNTFTAVQGYENAKAFALIDAAIADTDYIGAQTLLNGISTNNIIESNWKAVDNIILSMQSNGLSQNDVSTLQTIATQCPASGGNIVWRARALLNAYYNNIINYPNDCPVNNGDEGERTVNTADIKNVVLSPSVNLYPNPNNGNMFLDYHIGKDANLEIIDLNGNLVETYNMPASGSRIEVKNQNLQNGVYLYRINSNNTVIKFGKVVIMK